MGAIRQLQIVSGARSAAPQTANAITHFPSLLPKSLYDFCAAKCAASEWDVAQLWVTDEAGGLRCAESWFSSSDFADFCRLSELCNLGPGMDVPGDALNTAMPSWTDDLGADRRMPRAPVAEWAQLRCSVALPLVRDGEVVGVVEFLSREAHQLEAGAIEFLAAAAQQALGASARRKQMA